MSASGLVGDLGAFGIPAGAPATLGTRARVAPTTAERRSEARFALVLLTVGLASVYAISAATVAGRLPAVGAVLVGVAVLQVGWLVWSRDLRPSALVAGMALNLLLVAIWALSRTRGLPVGPLGPQSVGVLDTLCAIGSATVVLLAWTLTRSAGRRLATVTLPLSQGAIVLAVVTLSALAGGHTHASPAHAQGAAPASFGTPTYYCRLL